MASWKVQKRIKQVAVLNAYMFNLIIHIKAKVTVSTVFTDGFCSHLIPQRALHPILPKTRSQIRRNTVDNHFVLTLNSWEATFIQDARFVQQRVQSASRELHRDFSWLLWSPEISCGSTARSRQLTPKQHQNRGLLQKDLADQVWEISVCHSPVRKISGGLWTRGKKTQTNANVLLCRTKNASLSRRTSQNNAHLNFKKWWVRID